MNATYAVRAGKIAAGFVFVSETWSMQSVIKHVGFACAYSCAGKLWVLLLFVVLECHFSGSIDLQYQCIGSFEVQKS